MACTKRYFESVRALQKLDPQVLRDLLACFPEHVRSRGLELPAVATERNLKYEAIRDALMEGDIPEDLDDILHLATRLGDVRGWDTIERQAREDGRTLPRSTARYSHVDLAIVAETCEWPRYRGFLVRANARARVHSRSAYVYYAPAWDVRSLYRRPSEEGLETVRSRLTGHLVEQGVLEDAAHGRGVEVIPYDFANEVWFLIRYPGRQRRQNGCDRHGDWRSYVFNPEQYDAVAYSKSYGDIRMNTQRERDHTKYRMVIGDLLFGGASNVFRPKARVVWLTPVEGERAVELFGCDDVPGLASIAPVALTCEMGVVPVVRMTMEVKDGGTLLDNNANAPGLLPPGGWGARSLTLRYRLKDKQQYGKIVLREGNKVNYERDGDSEVVEAWLRKRGFVKSFLGGGRDG